MYHIRDDPQTFVLLRKSLEKAYALAVDLVIEDHLTVIVGDMRSGGFVKLVTLRYCGAHIAVAPAQPL